MNGDCDADCVLSYTCRRLHDIRRLATKEALAFLDGAMMMDDPASCSRKSCFSV